MNTSQALKILNDIGNPRNIDSRDALKLLRAMDDDCDLLDEWNDDLDPSDPAPADEQFDPEDWGYNPDDPDGENPDEDEDCLDDEEVTTRIRNGQAVVGESNDSQPESRRLQLLADSVNAEFGGQVTRREMVIRTHQRAAAIHEARTYCPLCGESHEHPDDEAYCTPESRPYSAPDLEYR